MSENIHHLSGNLLVGSSHFFVDTTNNRVGITTADPDAGLHVNSNAYVNTDFRVGSGIAMNVTSGRITAGSFDGDGSLLSGVNSDSGSWVNGSSSNIHLAVSTDNVGIGVLDPSHKLDVNGDINIASGSSLKLGGTPAVFSNWSVDGSDIYRSSGNVGIGVTPDVKLHVGGGDVGIDRDQKIDFGAGYSANWYIKQKSADNKIYFERTGGSGNELVIDTTGNMGIGTSSPGHKLEIQATNPKIRLTDARSTAQASGLELGAIEWFSRDNSLPDDYAAVAKIAVHVDNSTVAPDGQIRFSTGVNGVLTERLKMDQGGNVSLYGGTDSLFLEKSSNSGGVGIKFTDYNGAGVQQFGYLRYYHQDTQSYTFGNMLKFSSNQTTEVFAIGGSLMIGVDGKDRGYMTNSTGSGRKNLFIQSTYGGGQYGGGTSQSYGWWIGAQNQGLASNDNDLYFGVVRNGAVKVCGVVLDQNTNVQMNFTGQHRTFVKDTPTNQLVDKEGLIVSADQNEFVKMSGGVVCGNEAITINESLPLVSLSTKANDKKCFGVLSTTEDPETRKEVYGNFASSMEKEEGDTRVYVNSVGEGAVWVTNINGILESGDYITTSNVAGYGMKQNDDILHNYTVAKILMDCDFNAVTQPKRIIKKEPKMVDYWIIYGDVKITEEEYHTLPDSRRKIVEDVHHRIDQMEVVKEDPEKDGFVYEQREDTVNVLDEHGQFQWEDSGETEKAYKVRYLLPDGTQISEEEYTTRASMDEKVYIAAFVGCTYHCG